MKITGEGQAELIKIAAIGIVAIVVTMMIKKTITSASSAAGNAVSSAASSAVDTINPFSETSIFWKAARALENAVGYSPAAAPAQTVPVLTPYEIPPAFGMIDPNAPW